MRSKFIYFVAVVSLLPRCSALPDYRYTLAKTISGNWWNWRQKLADKTSLVEAKLFDQLPTDQESYYTAVSYRHYNHLMLNICVCAFCLIRLALVKLNI